MHNPDATMSAVSLLSMYNEHIAHIIGYGRAAIINFAIFLQGRA